MRMSYSAWTRFAATMIRAREEAALRSITTRLDLATRVRIVHESYAHGKSVAFRAWLAVPPAVARTQAIVMVAS